LSYRDALILLIPFVADKLHQSVDRLTLVDVAADLVRLFLADLEPSRQCTMATRNRVWLSSWTLTSGSANGHP
jgi:hypothetical protein